MVMNNIMHQVLKQQNQKFDLKNNFLLKSFCQISQEMKILCHKQFSHLYIKIFKGDFSQTTVAILLDTLLSLNSKT